MIHDDLADKRREAGEWYDACTGGKGTPERREAYIRTALSLRHSGRAEPKPRPLAQASLDAQPAKRAAERHRRAVLHAKLLAAAPLRSSKPQDDLDGLDLFADLK
jgi:hypothetical protein